MLQLYSPSRPLSSSDESLLSLSSLSSKRSQSRQLWYILTFSNSICPSSFVWGIFYKCTHSFGIWYYYYYYYYSNNWLYLILFYELIFSLVFLLFCKLQRTKASVYKNTLTLTLNRLQHCSLLLPMVSYANQVLCAGLTHPNVTLTVFTQVRHPGATGATKKSASERCVKVIWLDLREKHCKDTVHLYIILH